MMRPERAQRLDSSPMAASGLEELKKQLERRRATGAHESPPLLRSDRAATPTKLRCREDASSRLRHDPSATDHDGGGSFV